MESSAGAETGVVDQVVDLDAVAGELLIQRGRRLAPRKIGADGAHRAGARCARAPGDLGQAILAPRRQYQIVVLPPERVGELLAEPARGSSD